MRISLTFRNTEGENWQKEYVDERLNKIKKYIDRPMDVHAILSVEKFRNVVEVNMIADGLNINAKEEAKDMRLAIDNAIDKIERQLKKHKEKIRGHKTNMTRAEGITAISGEMGESEEEQEQEQETKLFETRKVVLKPMSLDDAVMEMDLSKQRFIIYRDSSSENVSLIYRRDDGNYALIETSH
jgi:putative sigma-54 modulation protein